jgi:1-pyrroline dehydrogenase
MSHVPVLQPIIDGKAAEIDSDAGTLSVVDPSTREHLADAVVCRPEVVDEAVRAARAALPHWSKTTPRQRSEILHGIADLIETHQDELATTESRIAGKPISAAKDEMDIIIDNWRFFAAAARHRFGQAAGEYLPGHTSQIRREPVGVAALIAPWNYPMHMATWKLAPALATGNTCVIKPSELTPTTLLRIVELAADLLPPGVVNVVLGDGPTTGAALTGHPDVNAISITGDVETGRAVTRAAAESLARLHLELGGNAPVVVLDDADVEAAATILTTGALYNAGQDCTAPSRIIATPGIYDRLTERLTEQFSTVQAGPTSKPETQLGPVISARHLTRLSELVDRAVAGGATAAVGGRTDPDNGFAYRPTVVVDPDQQSEIVQREIFGPAVTIQRAADTDTAFTWAGDVNHGLSASVWTRDIDLANRAARELRFGTVWINDHMPVASEMPFGGFGHSGHGKDMALDALNNYTEAKHVMTRNSA